MMIVLLTDFGFGEYVGVMKGVILSIDADATMVDLCHTIGPQSLIEASWVLKNNYTYFPKGAVFCCVVDPGVGSARRAIVVRTDDSLFVAPDNGLLWETLREQNIVSIRELAVPADASDTFHGRDVFAKAAARANLGCFGDLGEEIENIETLELYRNGREGIVVRIDRFGNVVTNLPSLDKNDYVVTIDGQESPMRHYRTYEEAPDGEPFLVTGSCATLEISLKDASANDHLYLTPGQRITMA
ncbi:MAG: SAM hydrolase/SAM-dependent halogenase family protein [Planctomycetota bacterium]|jgi:S-adenosylmethionine hydrolase